MKNWNNKDYVLSNVKNSGISLMFASEEIKADKQVVLSAVKNDGIALFYADPSLKQDPEFTLECAKISHLCLGAVSSSVKNKYEWQLQAIKANPKTFLLLAREFPKLCANKEACLLACKEYSTLAYFDRQLLKDKQFVKQIISINPLCLKVLSSLKDNDGTEYGSDKEIIRLAVTKDAFSYMFASPSARKDFLFAKQLVAINPNVYYYLTKEFKYSTEICLTAIKQDSSILLAVPKSICSPSFLARAIETNKEVFDLIKSQDKNGNLAQELSKTSVENLAVYLASCLGRPSINQKINSAQSGDLPTLNLG